MGRSGRKGSIGTSMGGGMGPSARSAAQTLQTNEYRKWLGHGRYPSGKRFYEKYLIMPSKADDHLRRKEFFRVLDMCKDRDYGYDFAFKCYDELFHEEPKLLWVKLWERDRGVIIKESGGNDGKEQC